MTNFTASVFRVITSVWYHHFKDASFTDACKSVNNGASVITHETYHKAVGTDTIVVVDDDDPSPERGGRISGWRSHVTSACRTRWFVTARRTRLVFGSRTPQSLQQTVLRPSPPPPLHQH